jgi:hypothetical protein
MFFEKPVAASFFRRRACHFRWKPLMIALPSTMNDAYFQATLDRFTKELQKRHAKRLESENF